jgi:hypothetical protein
MVIGLAVLFAIVAVMLGIIVKFTNGVRRSCIDRTSRRPPESAIVLMCIR